LLGGRDTRLKHRSFEAILSRRRWTIDNTQSHLGFPAFTDNSMCSNCVNIPSLVDWIIFKTNPSLNRTATPNNLVSTIFFTILPRGKNILELALKQYCPNTHHEKLKGLCKTRWVERHSFLKTFGELYEHVVNCLNAVVNPRVSPEVNESRWNWDSDANTTAESWDEKSVPSFVGVIVGFTVLKNSLDYLKGLSTKLQRSGWYGRFFQVIFEWKRRILFEILL